MMSNVDSQIILLVIAGVAASALLLQAIVLVGILFGMRKALSVARREFEDLRASALPFINESREFVTRVAPKIEVTSTELAALSCTLRTQANELHAAATEILERARRQADRLDSMTTTVLDTADRAGSFMSHAVTKPMRQVSGILASIKAVVETFCTPEPVHRTTTNHAPSDPGTFV